MSKLLLKLILSFLLLFNAVNPALAKENFNIYFFWGDGCPHCETEKPFLEELANKYPEVTIKDYEIWNNKENREYLISVSEILNIEVRGVPLTIVGNKEFVGFNESMTPKLIEDRVIECIEKGCPDSLSEEIVISGTTNIDSVYKNENEININPNIPEQISFPFIGEINTKNLSLPLFAIVLGALDGFNPCAMWTLLFLISLLLGMKDKRRRWILGITFIATSAFVYFLFMAAWLNLILFIGFIVWVRSVIALIALMGGGYNIREFFVNKNSGCKVTGDEKRRAVFEKLKAITHERRFVIALLGIILLAIAVNLVELICSAGLPVIFTQVLAMSNLAKWQYYGYMLLYIFVFMIDDLFVFFTAMITLEMTGISTKYQRASHLVGGILMVIIGLMLLFKPEWLMFG